MISEITLMRQIPTRLKKPVRSFMLTWITAVVVLVVIFGYLYWDNTVGAKRMGTPSMLVALIGLLLTLAVGGAAVRCLAKVAKAPDSRTTD